VRKAKLTEEMKPLVQTLPTQVWTAISVLALVALPLFT
jgi:hypothetical protein